MSLSPGVATGNAVAAIIDTLHSTQSAWRLLRADSLDAAAGGAAMRLTFALGYDMRHVGGEGIQKYVEVTVREQDTRPW